MKYSESKFFTYSTYIALLGLVLMLLSENLWFILGCVAVFGGARRTCSRSFSRCR